MSELNDMMASRSIRRLDADLMECRENINTWCMMYSKLYDMKRSLNKKRLTQLDRMVHHVTKSFTRHYYSDEIIFSDSEEEETPSTDKPRKKGIPKKNTLKKKDVTKGNTDDTTEDGTEDDNEDDTDDDSTDSLSLDDDIEDQQKDSNTQFQDQALNVLNKHEDEHAVLARHINEQRKKMQNARPEISNKPIKFTQEVIYLTDHDEPVTFPAPPSVESRPDNLAEDEVVLSEEIIESIESPSERVLTDAEIAELAKKSVFTSLPTGLPTRLPTTLPTGLPSSDPEKSLCGTMTVPNVTFVTDTGEPPAVGPLLKISPGDREKLYSKLYETAKSNVMNQIGGTIVAPDRLNELIRNESTRLLNVYKATH